MIDLTKIINETIPANCKIALAVSGGADSIALLHAVSLIAKPKNIDITVLHLNHCLRLDESDGDEQFCKLLSEQLGFDFKSERIDVNKISVLNKLSIEEAARFARYDFFEKHCISHNIKYVVTAHHADDQFETILMHLMRGCGLNGLGGIAPQSQFAKTILLRPLLNVTHSELIEYCIANNLQWREDRTNIENKYYRNRLRNQIIPELKQAATNNFILLAGQTAQICRETSDFIRKISEKFIEKKTIKIMSGFCFDIAEFLREHITIQREILRVLVFNITNKNLTFEIGNNIINQLQNNEKKINMQFNDTHKFYIYDNKFYFCKILKLSSQNLKVNSNNILEHGMSIEINEVNERGTAVSNNGELWENVINGEAIEFIQYANFPDAAKLSVKSREVGERYQMLNSLERKISDLMIDAKIPEIIKEIIPLVVCNDELVWLSGWRISEKFSVANNQKIYQLKLKVKL